MANITAPIILDSTGQDIADAIEGIGLNTIGNMSALTTTDKSSVVGAVNEVNSKLINETVLLRQLLTTTNATYDLTGNVTDYIFIAIILGWYDYDSNDNMIVIPSSAFLSNDYLLLYRKNDASTQAYAKINNRGYSDGVYSINAEGTEGVSIKVVGIIHK